MAKISIDLQNASLRKDTHEAPVIGIDLGTTHSLVAYVEDGQPRIIRDDSGTRKLVPSIIYLPPAGPVQVGQAARKYLQTDPGRTIYSVKRLLGKSYEDLASYQDRLAYRILDRDSEGLVRVAIDDHYYTPIELSAEILTALKKRVQDRLQTTIEKAVITVPAYFNEAQRQATRQAGKLAGLDILRIINEPTAASLAYGVDTRTDQLIAVFDLGGGTFDISILRLEDGVHEVLATAGDTWLGGDDIDQGIIDHWATAQNINLKNLSHADRQSLRLLAEEAKIKLSDASSVQYSFQNYTLELSRDELKLICKPILDRCFASCDRALSDAGHTAEDMDQILMVGGSTKSPIVRESARQYWGQPVNTSIDPDEVVALGAAIQADILAGNRKDLLLLDVTPLSLGIETVGGLMDTIIPRNTKVPYSAARNYTTSVDGQIRLKVSVYQGERELVSDNRKLGEFILENIPPMAAGLPKLRIRFMIDADGLLRVEALEERSDTRTEVSIRPSYGISEEEMARMLIESIEHAAGDMEERSIREAIVEAQSVIQATDKFISQNSSTLDDEAIQNLQIKSAGLVEAIESRNKDLILKLMEELNDYAAPLAQEAMNRNIQAAIKGNKIDPTRE